VQTRPRTRHRTGKLRTVLKRTSPLSPRLSRAAAATALSSAAAARKLGSAAKLAHRAGTDPTGASDF
jgi:hypothetical protein